MWMIFNKKIVNLYLFLRWPSSSSPSSWARFWGTEREAKSPSICWMTHRRSSTTDHTLASCSVCCAFTHHDRPITINRMPVLPPFLNPCHVSPVETSRKRWKEDGDPSLCQEGCKFFHHAMNRFPYSTGLKEGTTSFFLLLIHSETSLGLNLVERFCSLK